MVAKWPQKRKELHAGLQEHHAIPRYGASATLSPIAEVVICYMCDSVMCVVRLYKMQSW